jgi:hypothetical protein
MLSDAERAVLNTALEKYRPGQSEAVLVGGRNVLKPALRLMTAYRLAIDEIKDFQAITIYTRWVDAVQLKRGENEEVYLTFSPSLERVWLESKRCLLKHMAKKPANIGLRSQYALRLYDWANFRNRALYTAIREINKKTDLNISLESVERSQHGRIAALSFAIKAQTAPKGKPAG